MLQSTLHIQHQPSKHNHLNTPTTLSPPSHTSPTPPNPPTHLHMFRSSSSLSPLLHALTLLVLRSINAVYTSGAGCTGTQASESNMNRWLRGLVRAALSNSFSATTCFGGGMGVGGCVRGGMRVCIKVCGCGCVGVY